MSLINISEKWAWSRSRDPVNFWVLNANRLVPKWLKLQTSNSASMHILVKIKFESRPVLMSKHHDSLLFMVLHREALDRLCVRMKYLVCNVSKIDNIAN